MSRTSQVWDKSALESFFPFLKIERTRCKVYRTSDETLLDAFDYIERVNSQR